MRRLRFIALMLLLAFYARTQSTLSIGEPQPTDVNPLQVLIQRLRDRAGYYKACNNLAAPYSDQKLRCHRLVTATSLQLLLTDPLVQGVGIDMLKSVYREAQIGRSEWYAGNGDNILILILKKYDGDAKSAPDWSDVYIVDKNTGQTQFNGKVIGNVYLSEVRSTQRGWKMLSSMRAGSSIAYQDVWHIEYRDGQWIIDSFRPGEHFRETSRERKGLVAILDQELSWSNHEEQVVFTFWLYSNDTPCDKVANPDFYYQMHRQLRIVYQREGKDYVQISQEVLQEEIVTEEEECGGYAKCIPTTASTVTETQPISTTTVEICTDINWHEPTTDQAAIIRPNGPVPGGIYDIPHAEPIWGQDAGANLSTTLTRQFDLPGDAINISGTVTYIADDGITLLLNSEKVGTYDAMEWPSPEVSRLSNLHPGPNWFQADVYNRPGDAWFEACATITYETDPTTLSTPYHPIPLIPPQANAAPAFVQSPTENVVLGGVNFQISNTIFKSQASTPPHDEYPTRIVLEATIPHAQRVHLLLNSGNGFSRFEGRSIGKVIAHCGGTAHLLSELRLGREVREWHNGDNVVGTAIDTQEVWSTPLAQLGVSGYVDMLSLDLPAACREGTLTAVEIVDTSVETAGSLDPALNLTGVTVETAASK